jgi:hypothetical protein
MEPTSSRAKRGDPGATSAGLRSPGSPRRFAPRDDDSVKARRALALQGFDRLLERAGRNAKQTPIRIAHLENEEHRARDRESSQP